MKRVFISADIEGVTGVTHWDETNLSHPEHVRAAAQMTREVAAACRGAARAGAEKIWVRDAHDSARNIIAEELPEGVTLIRGWGDTPDSMMEGISDGFDCAICIGYHSEAGSDANPLAHTINSDNIAEIRINGEIVSELELNAYIAALYKTPIVLVSGDAGICGKAEALYPGIHTVPVKKGAGESVTSIHPYEACRRIERAAEEAVRNLPQTLPHIPEQLELEVRYYNHGDAVKASYYPGAERTGPYTVKYRGKSLEDLLIARMFLV